MDKYRDKKNGRKNGKQNSKQNRKQNGKQKGREIIGIIAGVLLAAAFIFIAVRLFPDKDARDIYFKAESRNFEKYSQWLNESYVSYMEKQLPYTNTANKRHTEVTVDIHSEGNPFGLNDADKIFDLIKRSKLVVDIKRQPQEDISIANVSLLLEKVPFIDAKLLSKSDTLYVAVPVLVPGKYFSAKLDELDQVYEKFSVPIRPKKLINGPEIAQRLNFSETELEASAKKLGSIFAKLITKDAVQYGDEKELNISGKTVKGREVHITLDAPSAATLMNELASSIAMDEALLAYTYGNFADLSMLMGDGGVFRLLEYLNDTGVAELNENERNLMNSLNISKDAEGFKKTFKEVISRYTVKDDIQMSVVIDKSGNMLDRRLILNLTAREGSRAFKLDIQTGNSSADENDCRNRFIKMMLTERIVEGSSTSRTDNNAGADGIVKITDLQVVPVYSRMEGTDTKGTIAIKYSTTAQDGSKSGADIELDISGLADKQTLKKNDSIKYKVKMFGEGGEGYLDGELNNTSWSNKKLGTSNNMTKISINADLPAFDIKKLSAVINLAREDILGIEPIILPEVKQRDVTDLNDKDMTPDRLEREMMASFGSFYLTNKTVVDAILGQ